MKETYLNKVIKVKEMDAVGIPIWQIAINVNLSEYEVLRILHRN